MLNPVVWRSALLPRRSVPPALHPASPGFRNEFHAGSAASIRKTSWSLTASTFGSTRTTVTTSAFSAIRRSLSRLSGHNSKIPGFTVRANVPNYHGFTAFVVMSSVAARFFTPQIGGVGAGPITPGASLRSASTTTKISTRPPTCNTSRGNAWPWIGFNWRYDSGLVAGPVPCDGGNCAGAQVPGFVDVSGLSPDQQFEAGLFCAGVFATPPSPSNPTGTPIIASGSCPSSQYAPST